MDIEEIKETVEYAKSYRLMHTTEKQLIRQDEYDYSISFGSGLIFRKQKAATKFIEAVVMEHTLRERMAHKLSFGYDIDTTVENGGFGGDFQRD